MQDAKTYRQYAEDCRKLAKAMPQHCANLLSMAQVWDQLAAKAAGEEKKTSNSST